MDNFPNIQSNKPKKAIIEKEKNFIQEGISKKTTNDNSITLVKNEKNNQTTQKGEDSTTKKEIKFIIEKAKTTEDLELESKTDNDSEEEPEFNLISLNSGESESKEQEEDKKKDNSRKEALKAPIPRIKQIIDKIIGSKLEDVNLNFLFGSVEQNKKILTWKMYQIFCISKKNRKIIKDCEPSNERDRKLFYFLLSRSYKFLFCKYYKDEKNFNIEGNDEKIDNFPTLNEIIEERKNKFYKKENEEQKINNFKEASKSVYKNFKDVNGRERTPKKLKKVTLSKFEDYLEKELLIYHSKVK